MVLDQWVLVKDLRIMEVLVKLEDLSDGGLGIGYDERQVALLIEFEESLVVALSIDRVEVKGEDLTGFK